MKKYSYILITITVTLALLSLNVVKAQNTDKYINRLVGDIDKEWLKSIGETISANQPEYSFRSAQGFKGTSKNARKLVSLDDDWFFYRNIVDEAYSESIKVQIPHKFEKNRKYNSAWYFSKYKIDKQADKRYFLKLNRVELLSMVYVNGKKCGAHMGAYTPFELEVTEQMDSGENVFAIFVYDKSAAVDDDKLITMVGPSRLKVGKQGFNLSGGIDDIPVLEVRENTYIKDIFVKTSTRKGEIEIEYEIVPHSDLSSKHQLSFQILKWPNGEKVELKIPEVKLQNISEGVHAVKAKWNDANLWSPDHPNLYVLQTTLKNGKKKDVLETRFGFREFWIEGKKFMLNGIPTRLRGESHYRVLKHGVDLHREEFKMYKDIFGSNVCRVHAIMPHGDIMLGADEAGMLIIDQSAVWSVNGQLYARGGDELLGNLEQEFEEWTRRDRNCPSVVIWDVENEMLRFNFGLHLPWVSKLPEFIKKFDSTRPFNFSGAGWFSPDQDMVSLHMQDNYARIMWDWKTKDTKPLITGEFWVGARADFRLPSAPEIKSVHERYVEEAATYERNILEMRYFGISGFMPFQISKLRTNMISDLQAGHGSLPLTAQEKEERLQEVFRKIKHGLQAVSVFFWPRETYCDAGKTFERELVICNDGETKESFEVQWKWDNQPGTSETIELKPYEQKKILIQSSTPNKATSIIASIKHKSEIISVDTILIHPILLAEQKLLKKIQVFDDESLAKTLSEKGYNAFSNNIVPKKGDKVIWVIPELANNRELEAIKDQILNYMNDGGNILCLKQAQMPSWFPVQFQFWSANLVHLHTYEAMGWSGLNKDLRYAKYATILAPSHPVFSGIEDPSIHLWNKFDGRVADDAYSRPSDVGKYEQGNWRPLVASAKKTQMSLAEIFYGKGTLLACQLHVIENLQNPQAKRLFDNMLTYLSSSTPKPLSEVVVLNGDLNAENMSELTGTNTQYLSGDNTSKYLLAFDGADKTELKHFAAKGGTVVVLSDKVSASFEGVSLAVDVGSQYIASKVNDHALLYGISSGNFAESILSGYFDTIPKNATVLLQGFFGKSNFWRIKEAGPVMISLPYEKGEILVSTINIDAQSNNQKKEFLATLLTNIGVPIPYAKPTSDIAVIKKTVPIKVDGKLDEWLDDMEDRLVSQYVHAQPIYLSSKHTLEGPTAYDLRLSGINYFLWNKDALHIAGVIFSEQKTAMSSIKFGAIKAYKQQIYFNNDVIEVSSEEGKVAVKVNGKPNNAASIANGQLNSKFMTDATKLQFSYINGGGEIVTLPGLVGETFELLIPWEQLSSKAADDSAKVLINLNGNGSKLQNPLTADPSKRATWMKMHTER